MKKAYSWITALLCAAAMVFSFTSCTNGDDDDNDSTNTSTTATTSSTTNSSDSDSSSGSGSTGTSTSGSTTTDNSSSSSGSGSSGTATSGSSSSDSGSSTADSGNSSSSSSGSESSGTATSDSSSSNSESAETISAYLPDEFASKEVSALYICNESYEEDGVAITLTMAYYFFSDGNWVVTNSGTETENGKTESFQESPAKGTYTHTGDFSTDIITRNKTHEWYNTDWIEKPSAKTITVTNGSFTEQDGDETLTFTKQ